MPRLLLMILALFITGTTTLTAAAVQTPPNVLEIIVGNGPLAGTYKPPTAEVICLHAKKEKRYTAAWKDFNAHDAKAISEGGSTCRIPMTRGRSMAKCASHSEIRTRGQPCIASIRRHSRCR